MKKEARPLSSGFRDARSSVCRFWNTCENSDRLAVAVTLLTVTNGAHSYLLLDGCGLSEPQYCSASNGSISDLEILLAFEFGFETVSGFGR